LIWNRTYAILDLILTIAYLTVIATEDFQSMSTITIQALEQRVKRKLAHSNQILHKCRTDSRCYPDFGDYYISNDSNCIIHTGVDLEALGRDIGVIRANEKVVSFD
jgi:hypothetical protein